MTKLKAIAFAVQELESEVKALPQTASEGWEECDAEWNVTLSELVIPNKRRVSTGKSLQNDPNYSRTRFTAGPDTEVPC